MKKEGNPKKCNLGEKLERYDQFGQTFTVLIDDGRDALPSKIGVLCSILLFIVMLSYTSYKINRLSGKKSIDIVQAVKEFHFEDDNKFTADQGLNFAVGVFKPSIPGQIDPTYGKIKYSSSLWGANENGEFSFIDTELKTHACSAEELGISGEDHKFWPIYKH